MSAAARRNPDVADLVRVLELAPHPEGGFYRETHRDSLSLDLSAARFTGTRAASTAIYYLLEHGDFSALHRIASDEVWHHYAGGTLVIHVFDDEGHRAIHLGTDFAAGERPQAVVPAGAWFGSRIETAADYVLVGCTVAPGFDFADFELATCASLLARYPAHEAIVRSLTRG